MIRYIGGPLHNKLRKEPTKHEHILTFAITYAIDKRTGRPFTAGAEVVYTRRTPNVYVLNKTKTDMEQLKFVQRIQAANKRRRRDRLKARSYKTPNPQHLLDQLKGTEISPQTFIDVLFFLSQHHPDELRKFAKMITEKLEAEIKSKLK